MPYDYARERDEVRAADLGDEPEWDFYDELQEQTDTEEDEEENNEQI